MAGRQVQGHCYRALGSKSLNLKNAALHESIFWKQYEI